eukprot:scaffold2103_cov185-Amphora_coffeaeformis.AAC.23
MSDARSELQRCLSTPPPTLATAHHSNPIAVAHAALESLRDSGDEHFLFLRSIIETGANVSKHEEEMIFHCVTGCRQVFLWKWQHHSQLFIRYLRDYIMVLGCSLACSRTVRLACFTAAAAFWKRGWNEELSCTPPQQMRSDEQALVEQMTSTLQVPTIQGKADLFTYMEQMLGSPHVLEGAEFLYALVSEFAGKSAVAYRLPLEFHRDAHRAFETRDKALTKTLELAIHTLRRILNTSSSMPSEHTLAVIQLVELCLQWEFGMGAFNTGALGAASVQLTLIRPPVGWQDILLGDGAVVSMLVQALQQMSQSSQPNEKLAHGIRQLVILFASLSGAIFPSTNDRKKYASFLLDATVPLLHGVRTQQENSELLDYVQLMGRLVSNFRLSAMAELPALMPMLQTLAALGNQLLTDQVKDCEQARGNLEAMELREWREEVLKVLLDSAVLLSSDPWLLYSGTDDVRRQAQQHLSAILSPLYEGFVRARTRMAALEEYYLVSTGEDLDEEEEEIRALEMSEEMVSVASFGRLDLDSAIGCLSAMHSQTMPRLQALWEGQGDITPEIASLLEEFRLLTIYVSQLLTDDNRGEQPAIPEAVIFACESNPVLAPKIVPAVQALLHFANEQVRKISQNPRNMRLSPILAKTLLCFIERWAPAYIYPDLYQSSPSTNPIVLAWSSPEKAHESAEIILSLCMSYQCFWPQEKHVQEVVGRVLISLARRRGKLRQILVTCSSFTTMVKFHCITAGVRHTASEQEFLAIIREKAGHDVLPLDRLGGFQRLPYGDRSHVLTSIMIGCSEESDPTAMAFLNESMKSVHDSFMALVRAFEEKQISAEDINAKEMANLCLELFCGIADAGEMSGNERIPHFVTPFLPQLAALMQFYAIDLGICEILLRFFRDYTENFVAVLTKDQTMALFNAVADLLKSYSANHCVNRVIRKSAALTNAEEEQAYEDIQTAIQLLVNLGAKDFIDACGDSQQGIGSNQVTDVIFLGLQQILPLMTQGLLQLPTLCSLFFDLVGFMMETYPDKVCALPFELFDSLLQSLVYGMSHHDANVAKVSLQGLASIAREHLKAQVLQQHLTVKPQLLDECIGKLIVEVVFQPLVVDRVEACGMALLPLAASDVNRLGNVINSICQQASNDYQRVRLEKAFTKLLQMEMLSKAAVAGFEGRSNRMAFKEAFQEFVNDVHSFLILK